MTEVQQLLAEYAKSGSEEAFREVVHRYVNLVYSTANRMVNGDSHLAQDVSQKVFADLAKLAGSLGSDAMLGGWLHRHTCFVASKTMRSERRRQAREQQAVQMNEQMDHSETNLKAITPLLDDAINTLGSHDRQAIVLRYFEQRDLREVGVAIGSNEDAARKRVNRALEKLRDLLSRRGVALSTTALASALGAQAVCAAPLGLSVTVATAALSTAAAGGGTAITILHLMSMTKLQGGVIAAVTLALSIPLVIQYRSAASLRAENDTLRAQVEQVAALTEENTRLSNQLAGAQQSTPTRSKEEFNELMRLRGQVGTLKKTAEEANAAAAAAKPTGESVLSGVAADPEMSAQIRNQQKMAMGMVYKGLAKKANLPEEKMEALQNLLADEVMVNIDHITAVLKEGKSAEEINRIFGAQEKATEAKVKELLGPEAYAKYKEYNTQMASYLTAEQFESMMLKGDNKKAQARQLFDLLEQERRAVLASRGLPEDYQLVPTLNFRNIASEDEAARNIALLDEVYAQAQARATDFLSPEEVDKFAEFRKLAVKNNQLAMTLNRKLMGPK
ncbi:MAG TPA: sigma-70 family RNA polymerase sigma factor [Verrucomicrobiae bacterium]